MFNPLNPLPLNINIAAQTIIHVHILKSDVYLSGKSLLFWVGVAIYDTLHPALQRHHRGSVQHPVPLQIKMVKI